MELTDVSSQQSCQKAPEHLLAMPDGERDGEQNAAITDIDTCVRRSTIRSMVLWDTAKIGVSFTGCFVFWAWVAELIRIGIAFDDQWLKSEDMSQYEADVGETICDLDDLCNTTVYTGEIHDWCTEYGDVRLLHFMATVVSACTCSLMTCQYVMTCRKRSPEALRQLDPTSASLLAGVSLGCFLELYVIAITVALSELDVKEKTSAVSFGRSFYLANIAFALRIGVALSLLCQILCSACAAPVQDDAFKEDFTDIT